MIRFTDSVRANPYTAALGPTTWIARRMKFDDTRTDIKFERNFKEANKDWMAQLPRREPDLVVDGLHGSLLSRLLSLFGAKNGR